MIKKYFIILITISFLVYPLANVSAATEDEILAQIDTYVSAQVISAEFADSLKTIISLAKSSWNSGDTDTQASFREAFRTAVNEACAAGDTITSTEACTNLVQMAQ